MRAGLRRIEHYANEWGNRRFAARVGAMAVRDGVDCLWGCDTSSLNAFRIAKPHGICCVLEQTIGHPRVWNRILTEERERTPADFDLYPRPYPEADLARVDAEIALADHIACGSPFVKSTMIDRGIAAEKVTVIPYGVGATQFTPAATVRANGGLRLLFVGHFGLRKGAWYLLQALARLKHLPGLTLTIVGKQTVDERYTAPVASMLRPGASRHEPQDPAARGPGERARGGRRGAARAAPRRPVGRRRADARPDRGAVRARVRDPGHPARPGSRAAAVPGGRPRSLPRLPPSGRPSL